MTPPSPQRTDALRDLDAQLERTARLATLGLTLAAIVHELNNILTPVLAYAQLARQHEGDAALAAKALERTEAGVLRATRITQTVLALARDGVGLDQSTLSAALGSSNETKVQESGGAGTFHGERGRTADVRAAVAAAVGFLPAEEQRWIENAVEGGLTAAIDDVALQHVIMNLLINARRAAPHEPIRITAVTSYNHMCLLVEDRGPGMPLWARARLSGSWEAARLGGSGCATVQNPSPAGSGTTVRPIAEVPGDRPTEDDARVVGGVGGSGVVSARSPQGGEAGAARGSEGVDSPRGLGLFICARLLAAAKGTIEAQDREGGGTVIRITLPTAGRAQAA